MVTSTNGTRRKIQNAFSNPLCHSKWSTLDRIAFKSQIRHIRGIKGRATNVTNNKTHEQSLPAHNPDPPETNRIDL